MAMGSGTLTVLGTTVVAALAVGAAVGVHALVGDPTAEPLAGAASETSAVSGDAFCELIGEMTALGDERDAASKAAEASLPAGASEAEYLDALHAEGEAQLAFVDARVSYLERAADLVSDPAVAEAFAVSSRTAQLLDAKTATLERDVESVAAYLAALAAMEADPELATAQAERDAANAVVAAYLVETCGPISDTDDSVVTAAKADAMTLGMQLTAFFVVWLEGEPLPEVRVADGSYYVAGIEVGEVSEGFEIADQSIRGPSDWCVSVTSPGHDGATYNFSARLGVTEGTCAALAGT